MSSKNKQIQNQVQQQDPTQLYNQLLAEKLSNTMFEVTEDQREHIAYLQSFKHCLSYHDLSGTFNGYEKLTELPKYGDISLLDSSYFLNGLDRISPALMGITIEEYKNALSINQHVSKAWNAQVMPIKTAVMREIQAKLQRNIIIPQGMKIHKD